MKLPTRRSATLGRIVLLGALAFPLGGALAQDQDTDEPLEEITVTGTALKRLDLNSALPVQVITAETLDRQGITNAGDMVEAVPAMQGFTTESDSVGGSGGGLRTANLRAIGSQYTLSLLNSRRMAPADSGSSIDLSNIPLAAVEQVQILTDGASALYGSDAIAGVVNFILKDSVDETTINLRGDFPETSGGEHWNFDIVTGFGDIDGDGYSLVAAFTHEEQEQLKATDRPFSKTGFLFFNHNGQELYFQNSSPNAIPGNARIHSADNYTNGSLIRYFNPNAAFNGGVCASQTTPDEETCWFDYTSTLEVLPESERDSLLLNGKVRINDNLHAFGTIMASQYEMTTRIAPYPTGAVPLWTSASGDPVPQLLLDEVWPHLTAEELATVTSQGSVAGQWRALPAGNRTTEWGIDSTNFTFGVEGSSGNIDYDAALTFATTDIDQNLPTGWLIRESFVEAASSAAFNIFAAQEDFTEADQAALAPTVYSGDWDDTKNTMTAFDTKASMPVLEMAGGDLMVAAGFDYRSTNYERTIAEANANEELLFLSSDTPYELERDQYGVFVEGLFPFADNFEATLSVRFDDISAVEDKLNGGDIDEGDSDTTYKISGFWNVNDAVALRASYGTGFKAPSMREIGEPRSDFGVTSGNYECPLMPGHPLFDVCAPGETQFNVFRQGYAGLKFETSKQYTFGAVLTPMDNLDITIDYWNIELDELVERLTEQQIVDNPVLYSDLYTTKTNLSTGVEELAIIQAAVNGGTRKQDGVDYAFNYGMELGGGAANLELSLQGTYIIESVSSLTGSSLGRFGNDDGVVFRNVANFGATLYHGDFTHTLWMNYRDGYYDAEQTVEVVGTGVPLGQGPEIDVMLEVPSYTLANYQLRYMMLDDSLGLSLGISNLFDREPPLSLRVSGAGHQVGWDPRFTDAYGRTFYLQANYGFTF